MTKYEVSTTNCTQCVLQNTNTSSPFHLDNMTALREVVLPPSSYPETAFLLVVQLSTHPPSLPPSLSCLVALALRAKAFSLTYSTLPLSSSVLPPWALARCTAQCALSPFPPSIRPEGPSSKAYLEEEEERGGGQLKGEREKGRGGVG